jgi:hypothetical protein
MFLWNQTAPVLFGLATVNFWQSLALLALCRLLFGGFGGKHFGGMKVNRHDSHLRERWMKMTPEERREFVKRQRNFGGFGRFGDDLEQAQTQENNEPEKQG